MNDASNNPGRKSGLKVLKITGVAAVTLTGIILILNGYGLFAKIIISEKSFGPHILIYDKWTGNYKVTGTIMRRVSSSVKESHGIECQQQFGMYFDNPRQVESSQLRSIAGCVVRGGDIKELQKKGLAFGITVFPKTRGVIAEFPFTGTLSVILGVMRVYPKLGEYIRAHHYSPGPFLELYDVARQKIIYVAPLGVSTSAMEKLLEPSSKRNPGAN
ncbi:MAG: hypothetical protein JXR76_27780 [Deltaproteobacteria bacterium]|nr:hypothetical protein [Deltaproteobacteria bacterium]